MVGAAGGGCVLGRMETARGAVIVTFVRSYPIYVLIEGVGGRVILAGWLTH